MNKERSFYIITVSLLLFFVGFLYGNKGEFFSKNMDQLNMDLSEGTYIRFVYIGSSSCSFSNNEQTHEMVSTIKNNLEVIAEKKSMKFISTGISNDISSSQGVEYLSQTGPYNELLVGGGSFNLGVINYSSGSTSTPKILLFLEHYDTDLVGLNINNLRQSQTLIKTVTGEKEIKKFYELTKNSSREEVLMSIGV